MEEFVNGYKCFNCEHCLQISPSFKLLKKDELVSLNASRLEITFNKGEIIYKQGAPLTHMVIIHNGFGKIFMEGQNGKNLILGFTKKYEINGGLGIFIDQRHHSTLVAATECKTCFVDIDVFNNVLKSNSRFMESYLKEHSLRSLHIYNQFILLTQKNMEGRMAESIIYLTKHVFEKNIIPDISNHDLSELTAMTKESAIRVLKEFKKDKLIEIVNRNIKVLNSEGLQKIALHG